MKQQWTGLTHKVFSSVEFFYFDVESFTLHLVLGEYTSDNEFVFALCALGQGLGYMAEHHVL